MQTPSQQALIQAVTAVHSIVGTVHLAALQENDPDTLETLQTVLAVALTARNLLEAIVEEPEAPAPAPLSVMGQEEDGAPVPLSLRPDPEACEHEDVLVGPDSSLMCRACGVDPRG